METKQTKRAEYYRLTDILKVGAVYNLIFGERSNGKSYAVKEYCLTDYVKSGNQFVVIRRMKSDISRALADLYLSDIPVERITKGAQNVIYTQAGKIYIALQDDSGKRSSVECCGYFRALSEAQRYSSGAYNNVKNIVLEEFISLDGAYINNEIMLFKHLISTIARKRDFRAFLIANSISRLSPYWREFGIQNIEKQLIGTIDVYEQTGEDGEPFKIACEYCANSTSRAKFFFGAGTKMTNEGKWLTGEYPHITLDMLDNSATVYQFVVEHNATRFLCEVKQGTDNSLYLFVTPKTTPPKDYTVVYTNVVSGNPYYRRGLIPQTARERVLLNLINNRAFFPDNLTGTEFFEVVKKLKQLS